MIQLLFPIQKDVKVYQWSVTSFFITKVSEFQVICMSSMAPYLYAHSLYQATIVSQIVHIYHVVIISLSCNEGPCSHRSKPHFPTLLSTHEFHLGYAMVSDMTCITSQNKYRWLINTCAMNNTISRVSFREEDMSSRQAERAQLCLCNYYIAMTPWGEMPSVVKWERLSLLVINHYVLEGWMKYHWQSNDDRHPRGSIMNVLLFYTVVLI